MKLVLGWFAVYGITMFVSYYFLIGSKYFGYPKDPPEEENCSIDER